MIVNEWPERELVTIFRRYGEERFAKQIARAIVRRRKEQPFERTGELVDAIKCAIPAPARFGEGHPAKRVFQALRIAVNDELGSLEARAPRRARDAAPGRSPRRDLVPLARGPDRQALPAREGARLHVPAGLPGLRVRPRAGAARHRAQAGPAVPGRGGREPALRVRAAARSGEDGSAGSGGARLVRDRRRDSRFRDGVHGRRQLRVRARPARRETAHAEESSGSPRSRVLLVGVVALNVAVLRVNMNLDRLNKQQIQLQAENTTLSSQLSSAGSSLRIEQAARRLGLVPAPASDTSYLDLGALASGAGRQLADPSSSALHPARVRGTPRAHRVARDGASGVALTGGTDPDRRRRSSCPPRAGRSSTAWERRSHSVSRRRPCTPIRTEVTQAAREAQIAAHSARPSAQGRLSRAHAAGNALRLRVAKGRPPKAQRAREEEARRLPFLRRGAAHVSAELGRRRRCSATPASTTWASRGSSPSSTRS